MITVLRRYVGHIIDPPQRLKSGLKTIGGMGCCTKERFYDGRAHGLSVQNRTNLPDTLSRRGKNGRNGLESMSVELIGILTARRRED